jgi:hypothetical protein
MLNPKDKAGLTIPRNSSDDGPQGEQSTQKLHDPRVLAVISTLAWV